MNAKEAIGIAKRHVADMFEGEGLADIGLEEVVHADSPGSWRVTVSFTRPWNRRGNLAAVLHDQGTLRSYKDVTISESDGSVVSVTERVRTAVR